VFPPPQEACDAGRRTGVASRALGPWRTGRDAKLANTFGLNAIPDRRVKTPALALQGGTHRLRQYFQLTKPRVVSLIVFCAVIGMFLAVPGMVPWRILLAATARASRWWRAPPRR
jgi:hypothetical protein